MTGALGKSRQMQCRSFLLVGQGLSASSGSQTWPPLLLGLDLGEVVIGEEDALDDVTPVVGHGSGAAVVTQGGAGPAEAGRRLFDVVLGFGAQGRRRCVHRAVAQSAAERPGPISSGEPRLSPSGHLVGQPGPGAAAQELPCRLCCRSSSPAATRNPRRGSCPGHPRRGTYGSTPETEHGKYPS